MLHVLSSTFNMNNLIIGGILILLKKYFGENELILKISFYLTQFCINFYSLHG